jgi:hypothetical protein
MSNQAFCHYCNDNHTVEYVPITSIDEYPYQVRDLDNNHVNRLIITGKPEHFLIHLVRRDDGQKGFWEIGGRHQLEAVKVFNQTEGNKPMEAVRVVLHFNLTTSKRIIQAMYGLNLTNPRAYSKTDQLRHADWLVENAEQSEDGSLYWEGQELSYRLMEKLTGVPRSTLQRRFSNNDDGADAGERERTSEMHKFWRSAQKAYDATKALFSKKVSGTLAGEKDIIEECRSDPAALNAAKQLAAFFNQVVEKAQKQGK